MTQILTLVQPTKNHVNYKPNTKMQNNHDSCSLTENQHFMIIDVFQ